MEEWTPKDVHLLTPRSCEWIPDMAQGTVQMRKVKDLSWEVILADPGGPNVTVSPQKDEEDEQGPEAQARGRKLLVLKAEDRTTR